MGKYIFDHIFLVMESLIWIEESNQDLILMLLDYKKKAYD